MPHLFSDRLLYAADYQARSCGSLFGRISNAGLDDRDARDVKDLYQNMLNEISELEQEDPEIMNWDDGALTKCRDGIVSRYDQYLVRKKAYDEEMRQQAEQRAAQAEASRQARIAAIEGLKDHFDVKDVYSSMADFISAVGRGQIDVGDRDDYVIEVFRDEGFKVGSLVDDYVIYSRFSGGKLTQFAVEQESDVFYGQDAPLLDGFYQMTGSEKFRNVLGAVNEILVFERLEAPQ